MDLMADLGLFRPLMPSASPLANVPAIDIGWFAQVASEAASVGGWSEVLFSGGWFGLLVLAGLFGLSLFGLYLVIDQGLALRRRELMPAELSDQLRQLLGQGRLKEADQLCRGSPCALTHVVLGGLAEVEYGWSSVEKGLEETTAEQSAVLYRRIEYLQLIGNIAPMLGLLGTVGGMIMAFRQVAVSQGAAGAPELAAGIYSALVTTVGGLLIAIPALGAFAVLRNRVDQLVAELAYVTQHVYAPLRRRLPLASGAAGGTSSAGQPPVTAGASQRPAKGSSSGGLPPAADGAGAGREPAR
jgi:biopolymer transport protein ExbB